MAECCAAPESQNANPKKHRCPVSGAECLEVSTRTIAHHIKHSWQWQWQCKEQRYFFCDDPDCDVVYFAEDDTVILQSQLRTRVGLKDDSSDAMLCYCFGVTSADVQRDASVRDFVVQQTRLGLCSCETSNPTGRCCLKHW